MYHHDPFCLIVMMMMTIILAALMPGAVFIYCWSLQIWLLYDYSIHRDQWRVGPYQCPLKGTKRSQKNISMITSYCSLLPIPPPKRDVRVSEKPPFSLGHKNTNRSNETRTKKNAQLQIDGICTLWIIFYSKGFCAPKGPAEIPIAPCQTKMVSTAPSKRTMIRIKLISMIKSGLRVRTSFNFLSKESASWSIKDAKFHICYDRHHHYLHHNQHHHHHHHQQHNLITIASSLTSGMRKLVSSCSRLARCFRLLRDRGLCCSSRPPPRPCLPASGGKECKKKTKKNKAQAQGTSCNQTWAFPPDPGVFAKEYCKILVERKKARKAGSAI